MKSQAKLTTKKASPQPRKKIFVGISGGVDSSVSAALLKKAGHDVTGVFIKVWQPDWIECNWKEERLDAMRAAAHLDIPFVTLNLEKEYKEGVIDYMIAEYRAGRTPNPDVMCNREVKFGAFWKWANEQGADFIATGHYARVGRRVQGIGYRKITRRRPYTLHPAPFTLCTGVDSNKDQSYFLWTLNQNDLPHVLFPVGHLTKPQVRKLAAKFKLPNADKKDSQGLCFIGKVDVKEFLKHYIQTENGNVLNEKGEAIGTHPGALLFTIGERHGFVIDSSHKTADDAPYYVATKNIDENTITVRRQTRVGTSLFLTPVKVAEKPSLSLGRVNWVRQAPPIGARVQARSRYRQELRSITIVYADESRAEVQFEETQETITPGQSLVIYKGDECLGGGIIQ